MPEHGRSPQPWRKDLDPLLRSQMLDKIVRKVDQASHGNIDSTEDLNSFAANLENELLLHEANSKEDCLTNISLKLDSSPDQNQKQIESTDSVNAVEEDNGGISLVSAMLQVASTMSSHERQFSQLQSVPMIPPASDPVPKQHMGYPFAANMLIKVKQEEHEFMETSGPILNSRPALVSPLAPVAQSSQSTIQSVPTQNQKQPQAMAHSQGQLVVQPNEQQQDHLLMQYASRVGMIYHGLELNQQQLNRLMYQILVNVPNPWGAKSQQKSGLTTRMESEKQQPMILNQKNNSPCGMPQTLATTGSAEKDNWREEKFQLIKTFKDAYLLELMELNQVFILPYITQQKLELLPKGIAEEHRFKVHVKHNIIMMLRFLLLEKSNIPENLRGKLSDFLKIIQLLLGSYRKSKDLKAKMDARCKPQICRGQTQIMNLSGDLAPSGGGTSSHHKEEDQLLDSQLRQNTASTTAATPQQSKRNHLLGIESSCFPEKLPGSLESLPTSKHEECGLQLPATELGVGNVSSPCNSLKSTSLSCISEPDAVKFAASSSILGNSTLPLLVAMTGDVKVSSSSALVKVTPSENVTSVSAPQLPDSLVVMVAAEESVAVGAATPSTNKSKHAIPTTPNMPVSPLQEETPNHPAEDDHLATPLPDCAAIQAVSPCTSVKSTLPSPFSMSAVMDGASPCGLVKSRLQSPISDSEVVPFASPCPSVKVTTLENIKTISASQLPNSLAAMVVAVELVAGAAATPAANESKEVTLTKVRMPISPLQAEIPDHLTEDHQLAAPLLDSAAIQVASPSTSLKSTLPSPFPTSVILESASPCDMVKSTLPSSISDSEVVLVASPCASVMVTSSENIKSVSTSQLQEKLVAGAAVAAQSTARGEARPAENESKQAETPDYPVEDHQLAGPVPSPCASEKSTLPSHNANYSVVEPTSGCAPVDLPCPSVQPITYENIESFSALLLQDNSATAAAAAEAAVGERATEVANGSKQLTTTKPIKPDSPLQAEIVDYLAEDGGAETLVAMKPIDCLISAERASSPGMHCHSANFICSLSMNKMKRILECTSSSSEAPPSGSMDGIWMTSDHDAVEIESNAEHNAKRQRTQDDNKAALLDEIRSANSMLIDTVISIVDDSGTDVTASSNGGTLIKFSYTAVSLAPDLKSLLAASKMCIVMPVKLSVPVDYPRRSPVLVYDPRDELLRKGMSDISGKVDMLFRWALRRLPELMSIKDMARAWDASVRKVVVDYAQQHGGGTFSSRYGQWERC